MVSSVISLCQYVLGFIWYAILITRSLSHTNNEMSLSLIEERFLILPIQRSYTTLEGENKVGFSERVCSLKKVKTKSKIIFSDKRDKKVLQCVYNQVAIVALIQYRFNSLRSIIIWIQFQND